MAFSPTIYNRAHAGLKPAPGSDFGPLGPITAVTFHHSAGPRAPSKARARDLHASYQRLHAERFGGNDISYHLGIDDHGRVYLLRPWGEKGAHTGGANSGNLGVLVHGNYVHDKLTWRQRRTLRWLLRGGFRKLGIPVPAGAVIRGHQEWQGHYSNACPGVNLMRHLRWLRNR